MANSASDLTPKIAQAVDLTLAESIWLWLQANIMQIIGAIAVLVIGLLVASFLSRAATGSAAVLRMDRTRLRRERPGSRTPP